MKILARILLLALLVGYVIFLVRQSRAETAEIRDEYAGSIRPSSAWDSHWAVQVLLIAAGLGLLVLGSGWLVDSAVAFARAFGVSDLVIGLTIIAAGKSVAHDFVCALEIEIGAGEKKFVGLLKQIHDPS